MSRKVERRFVAREITISLFEYSRKEFKALKAKNAIDQWSSDLDENSSSYPLFQGSPFSKRGLNLQTSVDEEPRDNTIYVAPHYFYQTGEYSIERPIDQSFKIKLAPVVGVLFKDGPMDFAEQGELQVCFDGEGAYSGSPLLVSFHFGRVLIDTVQLHAVDDLVLIEISKKFDRIRSLLSK